MFKVHTKPRGPEEETTPIELTRKEIIDLLKFFTAQGANQCLACAAMWAIHPTEFIMKPACEPTCIAYRLRAAGSKLSP